MRVKKRLWNRINTQIFVWAGEEPLHLKHNGFRFVVPPRNVVARKAEGAPYKFEAVRDGKDRPVPGTILVEDRIVESDAGGRRKVFDVMECCEYLQNDKGHLFEEGFQIVSDVADAKAIMPELIPLYENSMDKRAQSILSAELGRQQKWKEKGQPVPEPDNPQRVEWAIKHMASRKKTLQPDYSANDIEAALEGRFDDIVGSKPRTEAPPVEPEEQINGKALYMECQEWGLRLNKGEIEALLTDDEEQIDIIVQKLKAKRAEGAAATA